MHGSPFRDELACAHVKIHQLESENDALRSQLDRVPMRPRPSILVPLTTAWAILMTATVVRVSAQPMPVRATAAPVMRVPPPPSLAFPPMTAAPLENPSPGF